MKPLLFIPEATELDVPLLKQIAVELGKTLTFYDLETTTFLGSPSFGVTEVAAVHVHPDGSVTQQHALINPENLISEKAAEVTGISQDMVDDKNTWGVEARDFFELWARHHVMIGFNNMSFDNKCVMDQNMRYGCSSTTFNDTRDVRSYWRLMTGTAKGKLGEIAQRYGVSPEGAHRAIFDVRMTAVVLENFLREKGVDFFKHPGSRLDANKKLESIFVQARPEEESEQGFINQEDRIRQIIENCGFTTIKRLTMMLGIPAFNLSTMLGDMVYNDEIDPALIEDRDAQAWLRQRVPTIIENAWIGADRGKLKPVFEQVRIGMEKGIIPSQEGSSKIPAYVDYLQLRVYLKQGGYYAAMDKTPGPPVSSPMGANDAINSDSVIAPPKGGGLKKCTTLDDPDGAFGLSM
jgi:DNA polymerase III epsilon subunit-like protein